MIITGRTVLLGDNISARMIYPDEGNKSLNPAEMAALLFNGIGDTDHPRSNVDDIIVAGRNFGIGDNSLPAIMALQAAGIRGIIAVSFGRYFFRRAINHGLPIIEAEMPGGLAGGQQIEINLSGGKISFPGGEKFFQPYPDFILRIIEAGGLIPSVTAGVSRR